MLNSMQLIFTGIFGLAMGSFFGVLADRLPEDRGIGGRSMCDFCGKVLKVIDLIPVASFLASKARSRCCGKKLSWRYPAIELTTACAFVYTYMYVQRMPLIEAGLIFVMVSACIVIVFADVRFHIIPDSMTAILTIAAFGYVVRTGDVVPHVFAGIALASILGAIYAGTKGRGMGFGDVKLAFPMGLMLGFIQGFLAMYFAFILGGVVGLILLITRRGKLKSMIAFGPFLVAGFLLMVYCGHEIEAIIMRMLI